MFRFDVCAGRSGSRGASGIRRSSPEVRRQCIDAARKGAIPVRETDWAPVPSSPLLAVEHPIARVDTNDRVQRKPHVTSDVGPDALAETVYRGMATGQRWGRGRRQAQGPAGSPYGLAQPPARRPIHPHSQAVRLDNHSGINQDRPETGGRGKPARSLSGELDSAGSPASARHCASQDKPAGPAGGGKLEYIRIICAVRKCPRRRPTSTARQPTRAHGGNRLPDVDAALVLRPVARRRIGSDAPAPFRRTTRATRGDDAAARLRTYRILLRRSNTRCCSRIRRPQSASGVTRPLFG